MAESVHPAVQTDPPARNFILFSVGHGLSSIGSWAQKTGVGWLTWELTHSVAWVGTIAMADLIAALWVAPLAGAVADRSNPYRLFCLTQALTLLLALVLCAATATGAITIHGLLLFAVAESTLQGFNQPVRMLINGLLAPRERLSQAIAANSIAVAVARSVGPAAAGLAMYFGPVALVFALNALSFLAILGVIVHLRRWLDRPPLARGAALAGDVVEGFRYVLRTPEIAAVIFLALAFSLLARPFSELFPAFAGEVFGGGPEILSMLMSAQGLGALLGALLMLRGRDSQALARSVLVTGLGLAASLLAFTATPSLQVALPAMVAAGLFHVICNIAMQSLCQLQSAPALRGRVVALYGLIFRTGPAVGAFLITQAAHWAALSALVAGCALAYGALLIATLPATRRAGLHAAARVEE
ncbi:MFS transporter [Azoarcus indigens]|uniref:Putative MFS family arabinose efflux permease n=1 Tax=Azoarcus indigens TaxID=29545 RepID=A0A4R6EEZ0_9RHOO|nr:MFS transporter [Azoarcus indigens]TDN56824.1 putative MFS family arabinose efflux permease [Azoarcus indigens]